MSDATIEPNPVDQLMEQASGALADCRYFEAASLARRALDRARDDEDFERMARICLPLQEARRQIRQIAVEAAAERAQAGGVAVPVVMHPEDVPRPLGPGCYLLQPPMIGADARSLRTTGQRRRIPVFVLTREPMTRTGRWPIVGVAQVSTRVQVEPPCELERVEDRVCKDTYTGEPAISLEWFEAAAEALGDEAIASVPEDLHPWWRVDDLTELLDAVPEHERLHQALADACRVAMGSEAPEEIRRPGKHDFPNSF